MAIIFDRLSYAISGVGDEKTKGLDTKFRLLPQKWDQNSLAQSSFFSNRPLLIPGIVVLFATYFLANYFKWMNSFPSDWEVFLSGLPWWYFMTLLGLIVWMSTSLKFALVTTAFLLFLAAAGLWEVSMFTLAGTSVSVVICMVFGVPLGVLAASFKPVDAILRPILDTMQTMPAFVYLIPALRSG